jgi:diguanylate cyclase (GGDEF)-like protein
MKSGCKKSILLIECNPVDARLISLALRDAVPDEFEIETFTRLSTALNRVHEGRAAAIILDISAPLDGGVTALAAVSMVVGTTPVIILTDAQHEASATLAVENGAVDYLLKSRLEVFRLRRLLSTHIQRATLEEDAFLQRQRAEIVLSRTADAVVITDNTNLVSYLNGVAESITGWSLEQARGLHATAIFPLIDGVTRNPVIPLTPSGAEGTIQRNLGYLMVRRGHEIPINYSIAHTQDRQGHANGTLILFHAVDRDGTQALELSHSAQHDFLTDLPNRLLLQDRITQAISFAARNKTQLAVMFVDLDNFKVINDSFGHAIGDKFLQSVAKRIVACIRRTDTVSRYGGDEFVVLLSQVGQAEDAVFIARKILNSLGEPLHIDQKHLQTTASVGVATYPGDGQDAETLLHNADIAMYDAKKLGRNNCQFFRADMQVRALEWQNMQGNLRGALDREEFVLHYQPKIDLTTGGTSGVEALLRWNHPDRGLIQPLQFIPVAEESGLIVPIGQWVLLEACRQARSWLDAGLPPVRMAVNVSALQFVAKDFLSAVRASLISTGVDPRYLELELTETVLMQDAETAQTLKALKAIGVQLAVDDFGTGYSNLSYLRKFPLDALKVDRSFITEITPQSRNAAILNAMINIGKSLGHRVVAEGVETQSQLDYLQQSGCPEGQGYFFCPPVTAEKFAEFLQVGVRVAVVH